MGGPSAFPGLPRVIKGPSVIKGLAQALPLFVVPDDRALATRVRLDHYLQLVRAELHVALNSGATVHECAGHARASVPFWTDSDIADALTDRGASPLLRSYLWAYPAGLDWFVALAAAEDTVSREVLHAAYREPFTRPASRPSGRTDRLSVAPEALFVYGSLLIPEVLQALLGRVPDRTAGGWRVAALAGRRYPGSRRMSGASSMRSRTTSTSCAA